MGREDDLLIINYITGGRNVAELSDNFLDEAARAEGRDAYTGQGAQLFDAGDEKMAIETASDAVNLANPDPVTKTAEVALNEGEKLLSAAVYKLRGMG